MGKEATAELMGISIRVADTYYKVTGIKMKGEMKKWDLKTAVKKKRK